MTRYPNGWYMSTIGESCQVLNHLRKPLSESEREGMKGEFPYYGPTGILDYINEYRVEGRHVLFSEDGDHFLKYASMPMTLLVDGKYNVNNHAHIVRGTAECSTEWVYLVFRNANFQKSITRQGVGRFKLTKAALLAISLPVPPIHEQQRVVEILFVWDRMIELTEKLIKTKQRRKQCLMQQLLAGRKRFPGFGPPVRKHGELPEGWKRYTLKKITQRITRTTSRRDLPVLSITAGTGFVDQQDKFSKIIAGRNIEKYTHIRKGEFSYNKGNSKTYPQGCVYRLTDSDEGVVPNVYFSFAVKADQALPDFMSLLFESGALNQQLAQHINTGVRNDGLLNLNASGFFSVEVDLPSKKEQQAISSALMSADAEIRSLIKYCVKLRQQKRGLMQQLLTGRVQVKLDKREDSDVGAGD